MPSLIVIHERRVKQREYNAPRRFDFRRSNTGELKAVRSGKGVLPIPVKLDVVNSALGSESFASPDGANLVALRELVVAVYVVYVG
jgi:hypothetical protein